MGNEWLQRGAKKNNNDDDNKSDDLQIAIGIGGGGGEINMKELKMFIPSIPSPPPPASLQGYHQLYQNLTTYPEFISFSRH